MGAFSYQHEGKNLVAITEGEIDTLSIIEARIGQEALSHLRPVALGGVTMLKPLEAALKGIAKDLAQYGFIVMADGDEKGRQAALEIGKMLEEAGAEYVTAMQYPEGIKDPNDWLAKDKAGLIAYLSAICTNYGTKAEEEQDTATKELEGYKARYGATSALVSLMGDISSPLDINPVKTGFESLDGLLGGEMEKGLYILSAPSSLGKTSLMLQIADQIALSDRRDILFFSLEQSREELIAKSVSRLTYLLEGEGGKTAKTTLGILQRRRWKGYSAEEKNAIYNAFDAYRAIAVRLYYHEAPLEGMSIEDIQEAVSEHIRITKNKPIVFVDYLQIIKPNDRARNDKQAADMTISGLKRISAKYGVPILAISSLSRSFYYEQASMEGYKESGGIEYGADYALGLAFDWLYTDEAQFPKDKEGKMLQPTSPLALKLKKDAIAKLKAEKRNIVRLTMLKHRNGEAEKYIRFMFVKLFNCFVEITDNLNHTNEAPLRKMAAKAWRDGQAQIEEELPF